MAVKDINVVVADNLAYWMLEAKLTQAALAERAGVSQKTISNYLNPEQRIEGAKGKPGSPKLYELDQIAKALRVEVWQLTRQMTERQRAAYEAIEKAYQGLLEGSTLNQEQLTDADAAELHKVKDSIARRSKPARKGAA